MVSIRLTADGTIWCARLVPDGQSIGLNEGEQIPVRAVTAHGAVYAMAAEIERITKERMA